MPQKFQVERRYVNAFLMMLLLPTHCAVSTNPPESAA